MLETATPDNPRREAILRAVMPVFGRLGYRRASMDNLAAAAGLSKPGLYLHFSSKENVFTAAMRLYLEEGLALVKEKLDQDIRLYERLVGAMDAWFGRHMRTFTPASFDVIATGDHLSPYEVEQAKVCFRSLLESAIANSTEYAIRQQACTPAEIALVLFQFGLSWKQHGMSEAHFLSSVGLCVRACCQIDAKDISPISKEFRK